MCFVVLKILCHAETVLEESGDGSSKTIDHFAESSPEMRGGGGEERTESQCLGL